MQRERFKNSEFLYDLSSTQYQTSIVKEIESETFNEYVNRYFDGLEERYGTKGIAKFSTYLNCTEYGLTETEYLELLMPIQDSDGTLETHCGEFNFSSFCTIRNDMSECLFILKTVYQSSAEPKSNKSLSVELGSWLIKPNAYKNISCRVDCSRIFDNTKYIV